MTGIRPDKYEFRPVKYKCVMCGKKYEVISRHTMSTRQFCEECLRIRNNRVGREKYRKLNPIGSKKEGKVMSTMKKASAKSISSKKPVKKPVKGGKY